MSRISRPSPRSTLVGTAVVASLVVAPPATAAAPAVVQPLQALPNPSAVLTATGNRQTAWTVQDRSAGAIDAPIVVWTLRDGVATRIATLPGTDRAYAQELEVGTARDGTPLAYVQTPGDDATISRLIRLDTGAVRTISSTRGGLPVGGVGIDHGRYFFTTGPARTTRRSTSTLWSATIDGTSIGRATRLRRSDRGRAFADVLADRDRLAVKITRPVREGGIFRREVWAFGTPRGAWKRAGATLAAESGSFPVTAGFTQDRSAFVAVDEHDGPGGATVTRTPLGAGRTSSAEVLGDANDLDFLLPSYDPASGRILTRGLDATGAMTIGYTAPVAF
jgi:hypothetical protein